MSKVSVIIPTYKRAEWLDRALQSLAAQTFRDFEVFVIENGDSREGKAITEKYKGRDFSLEYIYVPKPCVVSARNLAIEKSKAEYIAYFDDDDEWMPEKLERQVSFLEKNPEYDLVTCNGITVDEKGREKTEPSSFTGEFNYATLVEHGSIILGMSTVMIRRKLLNKIGLMKQNHILHDYELYLRVAQNGRCYFQTDTLIRYYRHSGNMSNSVMEMSLDMIGLLKAVRPSQEKGITRNMIRASIDRNLRQLFALGSTALETQDFSRAGKIYSAMLRLVPTAGLRASWSRYDNPLYQFLRPYYWLAYASFKGRQAQKKVVSGKCLEKISKIMKKRILFISRYPNFFGGNKCLYHLLQKIDREQFEPVVMIPEGAYYRDLFEELGVEIHEKQTSIPYKKNAKEIWALNRWLMNFCKKQRIDLIHFNEETALVESLLPFFIWCLWTRRPFIFHDRSVGHVFGALKRLIFFMGHVICVSEAVRSQLLAPRKSDFLTARRPERVITIYDGIDTALFSEASGRERVRKEFGIQSEPLIGYISAIDPRKRQELFVEAAAQVLRKHPESRFMIVGDIYDGTEVQKNYKEKVIRRAWELGVQDRIIFTGYRDDVPDIMQALDVFVMTSFNEGLGDVVIEAMAARKPVVSTEDGGPRESVLDGKTGFLIKDHGNAESYAQKIDLLLSEPGKRSEMGLAGYERALHQFDLQKHVKEIQSLYLQLLSKGR